MNREDLAWLVDEVGLDEATALELADAVDVAETERIVDIHGYPKDNVVPPPLRLRLRDDRFVEWVVDAIGVDRDLARAVARAKVLARE